MSSVKCQCFEMFMKTRSIVDCPQQCMAVLSKLLPIVSPEHGVICLYALWKTKAWVAVWLCWNNPTVPLLNPTVNISAAFFTSLIVHCLFENSVAPCYHNLSAQNRGVNYTCKLNWIEVYFLQIWSLYELLFWTCGTKWDRQCNIAPIWRAYKNALPFARSDRLISISITMSSRTCFWKTVYVQFIILSYYSL